MTEQEQDAVDQAVAIRDEEWRKMWNREIAILQDKNAASEEIEYLRKELVQWNDLKVALGAKDSTAFFDALANRDKEIARLRKLVTEQEAWKESALKVMPDFQVIGNLMELPLGASVSPEIVPWMAQAKQRMAEMTTMMEEAITIFDRYLNVPESVELRKRWESFKNQTL